MRNSAKKQHMLLKNGTKETLLLIMAWLLISLVMMSPVNADLGAANDVEIVKRDGVLYLRTDDSCHWIKVSALDRYPVTWERAGHYVSRYVSRGDRYASTCTQNTVWVVASSARQTRPVYNRDKKVGDIAPGERCTDFVRYSNFDRQYRRVDGGGYALCEVRFVNQISISGAIN